MATRTPVEIDRERIRELSAREESQARRLARPARATCTSGPERRWRTESPPSYQVREPWPMYLSHGKGARVWDVDGNVMLDFHNGFGSMVQGHAHPAISKAVQERVALGTHFAAPVEDDVVVGEELARRWGLPKWRYVNSGSEATMDAIRIARAATGRDTIVKIFGSYHGHHDYVMVSIGVPYDQIGDRDNLASLPYGAGIPQVVVDMTIPVPFNDAAAMERRIERLIEEGRKPACVIMEAAMMNLGVVLPEPGYLESGARADAQARDHPDLRRGEDRASASRRAARPSASASCPDMVTLAKALGGGLPSGAIGGTEEVMEVVENGSVYQVGHVQRKPALDGSCAGEPARGADARRRTRTSTR